MLYKKCYQVDNEKGYKGGAIVKILSRSSQSFDMNPGKI